MAKPGFSRLLLAIVILTAGRDFAYAQVTATMQGAGTPGGDPAFPTVNSAVRTLVVTRGEQVWCRRRAGMVPSLVRG